MLGRDAEGEQLLFDHPLDAERVRAVKMSPLSVRKEAGYPQVSADLWRTRTTSWALTTFMTREATHSLEWSSMMLRTSNTSPLGSGTWVMSACQRSLGRSATNGSTSSWAASSAGG